MSILYRVYWNGGDGGPIDYSSPIGTTAETSFTTEPLSAPSDNWFGVRSYDPTTDREEENTDVRVRIVVDEQGRDVTRRPDVPRDLFARPTAGGGCLASWRHLGSAEGGPPSRYELTVSDDADPSTVTASATVEHRVGAFHHSHRFLGLPDGRPHTVRVVAVGASDHLRSAAASATFTPRAAPPPAVSSLVAVPRG